MTAARRRGKGRGVSIGTVFLAVTVGVLVLYVTLAGGLFLLAFNRAVVDWEREVGTHVQQVFRAELSSLAAISGELDPYDIDRYLGGQLDPSRYLVVFGPDGMLRFWYWREEVWLNPTGPGYATRAAEGAAILAEVLDGQRLNGRVVHIPSAGHAAEALATAGLLQELPDETGAVAAGTAGFASSAANSSVLRSLSVAGAVATLLALVVLGLAAVVLSRMIQRATSRVEGAILAVAAGSRTEAPAPGGIREYRRIAAATVELQDALIREEELRNRWTRDITHDLRTPVTALRAQLEGVRDGVLEISERRATVLLRRVAFLEALIESLLLLTRLESPEFRPERRAVRPRELLESLVAVPPHADTAPSLSIEPAAEGPVSLDPGLIERAVANLIDNAGRYGTGGTTVTARSAAGALEIEVANDGTIDDRTARRAFDRLHRGDGARTGSESHGLGLSIVQAIARAHGGSAGIVGRNGRVVAWIRIPG